MKKILGLDLGTNSIGWALIESLENGKKRIIKLGSRIVPMDGAEMSDFKKGLPQTKNARRREKKGARVGNKRYKMRRNKLLYVLQKLDLLPEQIKLSKDFDNPLKIQKVNVLPIAKGAVQLSGKQFLELRVKAIHEPVSAKEFGKVLYRFNQLRGYAGGDEQDDDVETSDVLGIERKVNTYPAQESKIELLKIISIEKTEEKKKGKFIYKIKVEDETNKEWVGETIIESLSLNDSIELKQLIRQNTKTGKITSIEFSIPKKTGWRKQMENLEESLANYSNEKGRKAYLSEYLLNILNENRWERIRDNVILRSRYLEEFDAVWKQQFDVHVSKVDDKTISEIAHFLFPGTSKTQETLRNEAIEKGLYHIIRNQVIYFQRGLKDQSHLIADCRFEKDEKAIAKSHPLFQEFKIWEQINKLSIKRKLPNGYTKEGKPKYKYEERTISSEFKEMLFEELQKKNELSFVLVFSKLKKFDFDENVDFFNGLSVKSKLKGNTTRLLLEKRLGEFWKILDINNIDKQIELWDILYNTKGNEYDLNSKRNIKIAEYLKEKGVIDSSFDKIVVAISCIKFPRDYASVSLKAIKKVLPIVRAGKFYDSNFLTSEVNDKILRVINTNLSDDYDKSLQGYLDKNENEVLTKGGFLNAFALMLIYGQHTAKQITADDVYQEFSQIKILERHSLRNPLVEQMINETLMVVKDIWRQYGKPEIIKVELARDLQSSIKERGRMHESMEKNQKTNAYIRHRLREINEELTKSNIDRYKLWKNQENDNPNYVVKFKETTNEIDKMKLWEEQGHIDPYTNQPIPLSGLFNKGLYDIDHIIPQSRYFDDSLSNKVVCAQKVNKDKGNRTAMEYIEVGSAIFKDLLTPENFMESVGNRFRGKKRNMLLATKLPENPIERQKKETQFISIRVREELAKIVGTSNVKTSSGSVTHYLRNHWGLTDNFKEILKKRFQKFYELNAQREYDRELKEKCEEEMPVFENYCKSYVKEHVGKKNNSLYIKDYSKRYDHRHHAMDALVVACADEKAVKRLNDLNKHLQDWLKKNINQFGLDLNADDSELLDKFLEMEDNVRKKVLQDIERFRNVKLPWNGFNEDFKQAIEDIIVSHKPKDKLLIQYETTEKNGKQLKQRVIKIRGPLHEETVYGLANNLESYRIPLSKFTGAKFATEKNIEKIISNFLRPIIYDHFVNVYKKKKTEAFGSEGLMALNKRLSERKSFKNGKEKNAPHPPITSVKIYRKKPKGAGKDKITLQKMDRKTSYNNSLYVNTGSNYLFAVLDNNGKRDYDIISLFEAAEYLKEKFNNSEDKISFNKQKLFDDYFENINEGKFLFSLKTLDMIYLPNDNEDIILDKESSIYSDYWKDKKRAENIFVVNKFSGKRIYFTKHTTAEVIEKKVELGSQNMEEFINGRKVIEYCFPIKLDRLGNIIEVNGMNVLR